MSRVFDTKNYGPHTVSSEQVWAGEVFAMRTDQVELREGDPAVTRDYVDHPGAVGIVAIREIDGVEHVLLVRQYRHPIAADLWEIPAGLLDVAGEEPIDAARRELREEADLQADTWHVLIDIFTSPGSSNESLRVFLARGITELDEKFERTEEEALMEALWVPLGEAVQKIFDGSLHNPSAVVGILGAWGALTEGKPLRSADAAWLR